MKIIVKYTFQMRVGGWDFTSHQRFETFGKALRWVMKTKANGSIKGFKVVDIMKDVTVNVDYSKYTSNKFWRGSVYKYEGSTDAELVGGRY